MSDSNRHLTKKAFSLGITDDSYFDFFNVYINYRGDLNLIFIHVIKEILNINQHSDTYVTKI